MMKIGLVRILSSRAGCFISSFCYPIVSYDRDKLLYNVLRDNGVECRPLIAGSMTMSPMWKKFGTGHTNIPVSTMINKYGFLCSQSSRYV